MEVTNNQSNNLTPKELLDIKKIIQLGKKASEDYLILFYKSIHSQEVKVRIRALSNYEYDVISLEMYNEIKDPATINYLFNPDNEDEVKNIVKEGEAKKDLVDRELPPNVSVVDISKAYLFRNVLIAYYSMKDFYQNLTLNEVKQMEGLDEIADRVNTLSGRTKEVMEKIHFFRDELRKSNNKVSPK
jgi:hypothetical protein